jgi:hypothetical protein
MNLSSKQFPETLQKLEDLNKAAEEFPKVNPNHLLLVALSTTVMIAKNQPIDKEYYQWTRLYLDNIRDDEGKKLQNMVGLTAKINDFERQHNIDDELVMEPLGDDLGISKIGNELYDDYDSDIEQNFGNAASSTKNPIVVTGEQKEGNVGEKEKSRENENEDPPENQEALAIENGPSAESSSILNENQPEIVIETNDDSLNSSDVFSKLKLN